MSNYRYGPEDWRNLEELLEQMPVKEIVALGLAPMSEYMIRRHARSHNIDLILPKRKRKEDTKAVNEMLANWGRPIHG